MSGPLTKAEAEERMRHFEEIIRKEGQEKANEIKSDARDTQNAMKSKMVSRLIQGVNQKYERLSVNRETTMRTHKSTKILEARTQCQNDRHFKTTEIKSGVEEKLQQRFASDPASYRKFMKDLLLESCIRLLEQVLQIRCLKKV